MPRSAVFVVRLSKPSSLPIAMKYRTLDASATQPSDYTSKSGSINFRPGETIAQIVVPIRDNIPAAGPENFELEIYDKTNASIARAKASCIIPATAADSQPVVTVENITVASQGAAVFTVTLSRAPVAPATINYKTSDDTAIAGKDYTAASGTVSFSVGETSKTVTVQTLAASDRALIFHLDLLKPNKCTLYQNSPAAATIQPSTNVVNLVNAARYALDVYNMSIETIKTCDANLTAATTAYNDSVTALAAANKAVTDATNYLNWARYTAADAQNTINVGAMLGNWGMVIAGQSQLNNANYAINVGITKLAAANKQVANATADKNAKKAAQDAATTAKANAQTASDTAKMNLDAARAAATAAFIGSTTLVLT